jgi:peptidoglycan/LPS O-acetylase OafA/YrhL
MFGMRAPDTVMTLQDRMSLAGGHTQGFNYLRLVLAIGVVAWHTVVTCYGKDYQDLVWDGWTRPPVAIILPMFFALSGFLVAGSLERCRTLTGFLSLRALRLIPALAVEVLLSALMVGPLVTNLAPVSYFSSPDLFPYFLNIAGDIHYNLPGVFTHNPLPSVVNGQLWTIPYELRCYLLISLFALCGLHHRKGIFLAMLIAVQGELCLSAVLGAPTTNAAYTAPGDVLVLCFLGGIAFHLHRNRIVHSHALGAASLAATAFLLSVPKGDLFVAISATYFTVYIGLLNPVALPLIRSGDYSYGIFLYGFPIQQAIAHWGNWTHNWIASVALSIPLVACVAALSWHCVEKHALKLRRYIPAFEDTLAANALARFGRFKGIAGVGEQAPAHVPVGDRQPR